jgi:hypothetical protein
MPNGQPHPYHIHPTYFTTNPNAQPGPSISRRRSSLQPNGEARASLTESDKFRDAEEDARDSGDYDMGKDLLAFNPPPPRGYDSLSSPYRQRPFDQSNALSPNSTGMSSPATSPGRERLPSSNSITSMSSNTGGRRAPAPAALELSPRKERPRNQYESLGHGVPVEQRRVATEPPMDRVSVLAVFCDIAYN